MSTKSIFAINISLDVMKKRERMNCIHLFLIFHFQMDDYTGYVYKSPSFRNTAK